MAASKWTQVDAINCPIKLSDSDYCYYYLVYTPRAGYEHSQSNQDILNYKIPIGTDTGIRIRPQRTPFKQEAIHKYAEAIIEFAEDMHLASTRENLVSLGNKIGLLPMPPSMPVGDINYDDRNVQTCKYVCDRVGFKLCRDIETIKPLPPSHSGGTRRVSEIESSLGRVAHNASSCEIIFIVDDVLVTGSHFAAAKDLLVQTGFTGKIFGLFYARAMYQELE